MLENESIAVCPPDQCNIPCFNANLVHRLRSRMPEDGALETARTRFAGLADKTRLKILLALRHGDELCVCDVAHVLGMSISSASHHLRKLRDLGMLQFRSDGKMAYYALRDPFAAELAMRALKG